MHDFRPDELLLTLPYREPTGRSLELRLLARFDGRDEFSSAIIEVHETWPSDSASERRTPGRLSRTRIRREHIPDVVSALSSLVPELLPR